MKPITAEFLVDGFEPTYKGLKYGPGGEAMNEIFTF